jgi:AcrR family transcriptional regulator
MDACKPEKVAGRPRDPLVEERILEVTLRQLRELGYARMSVEQVAATSGIGKPAIYRRWKGKADLATAALRRLQISEPEVRARSTVEELQGVLENFRKSLLRPYGMALVGTVLAEEAHTPELLRLFRERLVAPRRNTLRAILKAAGTRGELRDGVAVDAAVAMLVGAVYAQYLAESKVSPAFIRAVVETVWSGIGVQSGAIEV